MSIGSILVGVAVLAVVVAYLARPFRPAADAGIDRTIEAWVTQVQAARGRAALPDLTEDVQQGRVGESAGPAEAETDTRAVNYCPQCGQRVDEHDRFCSGCGTQLRGSA
jgi:hypothetical protein